MTQDSSIAALIAPNGILRVSINVGNPILARRQSDGEPAGVSIDIAKAYARKLGLNAEFIVHDSARASVETVASDRADIGFFAIDPARATNIRFTGAYVLIEGAYVVKKDSPVQTNAEVDRTGTRVTVGKGSAYDLFLTRELKNATLERTIGSPSVIQTFLDTQADVAAGVKPQLQAHMKNHAGLRLLPGAFMTIRQAMGLPSKRGETAWRHLFSFVEDLKATGFVAEALKRHHIEGASVAPGATLGSP